MIAQSSLLFKLSGTTSWKFQFSDNPWNHKQDNFLSKNSCANDQYWNMEKLATSFVGPSLGEWKARLNPGEKPGKRNRWRRAGATLLGRSSPTNWESEKPTNWVKATLHSHHPSQWTHAAKQERIDIANVIWKCLNAALPSEHVRWQQSALKCMNIEMLLHVNTTNGGV